MGNINCKETFAHEIQTEKTACALEDLLGSKLAEAPEDAAMLDIIWASIVSDAGVITSNLSNNAVDYYLYLVPKVVRDGVGTYASYHKTKLKAANRALEGFFNPKTRH